MAEQRLIDAEALTKKFEKLKKEADTLRDALYLDGVLSVIDTAPTIETKPVVHAHWVSKDTMEKFPYAKNHYCSNCKVDVIECGNFCTNCGAQMDEKE